MDSKGKQNLWSLPPIGREGESTTPCCSLYPHPNQSVPKVKLLLLDDSPAHFLMGVLSTSSSSFSQFSLKDSALNKVSHLLRTSAAFHWGAKAPSTSFEPESNQRPKDDHSQIYSPPLYQLSYRRMRATKRPGTSLFPEMPQHDTGASEMRPVQAGRKPC